MTLVQKYIFQILWTEKMGNWLASVNILYSDFSNSEQVLDANSCGGDGWGGPVGSGLEEGMRQIQNLGFRQRTYSSGKG